MENIKLVCFDLNNTIIKNNSWLELNLAIGMTPEEDQMFIDWYNKGIITYEEGQRFLARYYKQSDRATLENITKVLSEYTYQPGAKEIIKYLKNKSYELALISGAIDIVVDLIAKELDINFYEANNIFIFDENDHFETMEVLGEDHLAKLRHLESFCRRLNIDVTQCACVGDGRNDAELFRKSKHGVTFKGAEVEHLAWKVISSLHDLKEIL